MTTDYVDRIVDDIIRREGGFVNHPSDPGGATKYGVTLATVRGYGTMYDKDGDGDVDADDVALLTLQEARDLYRRQYVDPMRKYAGGPVMLGLFADAAVNHGVARVSGWLDEILINTSDPNVIYKLFLRRRIIFFGEITKRNPKFTAFIEGWLRRVSEFVR